MALKALWQRMTLADRLLVFGLLLGVALLVLKDATRPPGLRLIIEQDNRITHNLSLQTDSVLDLAGPLGSSRIVIADGTVRFVASPCPNKVCIGMGRAAKAGDLLACVPNHVLLRITGRSNSDGDYDLITR